MSAAIMQPRTLQCVCVYIYRFIHLNFYYIRLFYCIVYFLYDTLVLHSFFILLVMLLLLFFFWSVHKLNIPTLPSLIIGEKTRVTAADAARLTTGK